MKQYIITVFAPLGLFVGLSFESNAALICYDGADYAITNSTEGLNGGIGWLRQWFGTNNVAAPGLVYTGLATTGNRFTTDGGGVANFRRPATNGWDAVMTPAQKFGLDGTTLWVSFLCRRDTWVTNSFLGFSLYDENTEALFIGCPSNRSNWGLFLPALGNPGGVELSSQAIVNGETVFLVARLRFGTSGMADAVDLFINPTPGGEPTVASATKSGVNILFNRIRFSSGSSTTTGSFDEFRIGTTYGDVAPVPATDNSTAKVEVLHSLGEPFASSPNQHLLEPDGTFLSILRNGPQNKGVLVRFNADCTDYTTVLNLAEIGTNLFSPGSIVGPRDTNIYFTISENDSGNSAVQLVRVSTDGRNYGIVRTLPGLQSNVPWVLAIDNRFYLALQNEVVRFDLDGSNYQSFSNDLQNPVLAWFEGSDGLMYGAEGTRIFRLRKDGTGFETLANPNKLMVAFIEGSEGALYGVYSDYPNGCVVFVMNRDGTDRHTLKVLDDGSDSVVNWLRDNGGGRLYALWSSGPPFYGSSFIAIDKSTGAYTRLKSFVSGGLNNPAFGTDGWLYAGTTKIKTDGTGFQETIQLGGTAGFIVQSPVTFGPDGWLYGSTRDHYDFGGGVFRMNPLNGQIQSLKMFPYPEGAEGISPRGGVVVDGQGDVYGTTTLAGSNGGGTIFKISTTNPNKFQTLHQFNADSGTTPLGQILLASDGNLYGSCSSGGAQNRGTIWRISRDGSGFIVLHHFQSTGNDGLKPFAPISEGPDGALYGTTDAGGASSKGTIWRMEKNGGNYELLRSLGADASDLTVPEGKLLITANGTIIGTGAAGGTDTFGGIFSLKTNGSSYKVLRSFLAANSDARTPVGGLITGPEGYLFGTSKGGGFYGAGTLYRILPDGSGYQVVYNFGADTASGREPWAMLAPGPDGYLYGGTYSGGYFDGGHGVIFRVNMALPGFSGFAVVNGKLELSWSVSLVGYVLERTSQVGDPASWSEAPEKPVLSDDKNHVTIDPVGPGYFYRVRKR